MTALLALAWSLKINAWCLAAFVFVQFAFYMVDEIHLLNQEETWQDPNLPRHRSMN